MRDQAYSNVPDATPSGHEEPKGTTHMILTKTLLHWPIKNNPVGTHERLQNCRREAAGLCFGPRERRGTVLITPPPNLRSQTARPLPAPASHTAQADLHGGLQK